MLHSSTQRLSFFEQCGKLLGDGIGNLIFLGKLLADRFLHRGDDQAGGGGEQHADGAFFYLWQERIFQLCRGLVVSSGNFDAILNGLPVPLCNGAVGGDQIVCTGIEDCLHALRGNPCFFRRDLHGLFIHQRIDHHADIILCECDALLFEGIKQGRNLFEQLDGIRAAAHQLGEGLKLLLGGGELAQ